MISALKNLCSDVDVLFVLILHLRNGSGLDRSSPKHLLRCLTALFVGARDDHEGKLYFFENDGEGTVKLRTYSQ